MLVISDEYYVWSIYYLTDVWTDVRGVVCGFVFLLRGVVCSFVFLLRGVVCGFVFHLRGVVYSWRESGNESPIGLFRYK